MQGFRTHAHIQLHQDDNVTEEPEHNEVTNKEIKAIQPELQCKLKHSLQQNTDQIAPLDRGLTFNSTNNEEFLTNTMEVTQPIACRTNVGQ